MNGFVVFDANDRVHDVSEKLVECLGYSLKGELPTLWTQLSATSTVDLKPRIGEVSKVAGFLFSKDGSVRKSLFKSRKIGTKDGVALYVLDVELQNTNEREVEKELASLEFLSTVSHELRVSLNGVIGFANLLENCGLTNDQSQILKKMQSCNFVLKGLVDDVLEYSRVVSSKVDLSLERLELSPFVSEVIGLFQNQAEKKGLSLELCVHEAIPSWVELPKLRVTQVLSNLLSNAIKFTDSGSISLRVEPEKEGMLRFCVIDTGPGILDEDFARIFQPFVQADENAEPRSGSGLGLAISKNLAERMNGTLNLEKSDEAGSVFVLELPIKSVAEVSTVEVDPGGVGSDENREIKRVLIVEDNKVNADILCHFLREYGAGFDVVDNGRLAVETYEDGKYDLILMDVMLPELNGYEATEQILIKSNRKERLPIIGVTAKVFRRDQMRCLEAGMVEVVHKPVDFAALGVALDKYLYGKGNSIDEGSEKAEVFSRRYGSLNPKVLDGYVARMSRGNGSCIDVLSTAMNIIDSEVVSLVESIECGDRENVSLRAHSLKGALSLLGATDLLDLSKGLELVASQEGEPIRKAHWKGLIEGAYKSFRDSVDSYQAQLK